MSSGGGYGPVPSPHHDGGYGGYPPQQGGYGHGGYQQDQYGQGYSQPQTNYQIPQTNYQPSGSYPPQAGYPGPSGQGEPGDPSMKGMGKPTTMIGMLFFAAACCVVAAALICGFFLLLGGQFPEFLMMSYLLVFGAIMAILDTPFFKQIKALLNLQMYIGKYVNILLRVTGKGLAFVFLSCTLFSGIWNSGDEDHTFMRVLACLLCPPPFLAGVFGISVGLVKSKKLKNAQDTLKEMDMAGALEQRLDQWAQTYRGERCAFTPLEYNKLCEDTTGIKWEDGDLKLIFDSLVSNPKWRQSMATTQSSGRQYTDAKIPKEDLLDWVRGGLVFL